MTTKTENTQTQYGLGAPVATAPNGTRYFDTTTSAWAEYICYGGTWYAVGAGNGVILPNTTVGALPAAAAGNKGYRSFVTDSNAALTAGIGAVVAAGGANNVPVVSDGTNWRIG